MEEEKTYLTEEGLEKLRAEYNNLVHNERESVKKELADARSLGDLAENADYDAARERQAKLEHRISELEDMLRNYEIIDTKTNSKVIRIGSKVTLQFLDTKEKATYQIVGRREADPLGGFISNETPVARAILDKKPGQTVEVSVKKPYKILIISVE